jgi:perosamine synthetase
MDGGELERVSQVLASNYINEGDVATEFEQAIAKAVGAKFAVATTSGTSALFLGLAALGVSHGDEVLVPDLTFIATANAVRLTGATPVLVDVDPQTLNMDPAAIERALTPRTRAIMPVHVSGRGADLPRIAAIAIKYDIPIVEDAAEALRSAGADGRFLGTIGAAGCFSFSPNKTITTGQGGIVVTSDAALHERLRMLKDHGRPVRGTGGDDIHHCVGYNFKLTNLQAAVGLAQMAHLEARLERQRAIYRIYAEELAGLPGIRLPGFDLANGASPLWTDAVVERRDDLDRYLRDRNAHCRRFWLPLHTQAPYARPDAELPNSTRVGPQALWLPSSFTLSDDDVRTVTGYIKEFLRT